MEICNKQFLIDTNCTVEPVNVVAREQLIQILSLEFWSEDRCPILTMV